MCLHMCACVHMRRHLRMHEHAHRPIIVLCLFLHCILQYFENDVARNWDYLSNLLLKGSHISNNRIFGVLLMWIFGLLVEISGLLTLFW